MFHQLIYLSSPARKLATTDLDAILVQARANNASNGVTGLLLFNGERFVQLLEGAERDVERVFASIEGDPRHHNVRTLLRRQVVDRQFGQWEMAFEDSRSDAGLPLAEQLADSLDDASLNIQRLFEEFARAA